VFHGDPKEAARRGISTGSERWLDVEVF